MFAYVLEDWHSYNSFERGSVQRDAFMRALWSGRQGSSHDMSTKAWTHKAPFWITISEERTGNMYAIAKKKASGEPYRGRNSNLIFPPDRYVPNVSPANTRRAPWLGCRSRPWALVLNRIRPNLGLANFGFANAAMPSQMWLFGGVCNLPTWRNK